MPTTQDIAWAAGLFEGEGCITLWQKTPESRSYPRIELGSSDEDVVRRFNDVIGGGKVLGPYTRAGHPDRPTRKPMWFSRRVGASAREALALLAPYLGERRTARMHEVLSQATGGGGRWPSK
jgi:hypothetical protein